MNIQRTDIQQLNEMYNNFSDRAAATPEWNNKEFEQLYMSVAEAAGDMTNPGVGYPDSENRAIDAVLPEIEQFCAKHGCDKDVLIARLKDRLRKDDPGTGDPDADEAWNRDIDRVFDRAGEKMHY